MSSASDQELTKGVSTLSNQFRHHLASRFPFRHSKDFHDERILKDAIHKEKSKLMKQVVTELENTAQEFEKTNQTHREEAMTYLGNYSKFLSGKYESTIGEKIFENPKIESGELAVFLKEEKLKVMKDFMEECKLATTGDYGRGLEMELETKLDAIKNECLRNRTGTNHQVATGSGVKSQGSIPVYDVSSDEDVKGEVDSLNLRSGESQGKGGSSDARNRVASSSYAVQNLMTAGSGPSSNSNQRSRRSSSDAGPSRAKKQRPSGFICDKCGRMFQEFPEYENHSAVCQNAPRAQNQSPNPNPNSSIPAMGNPSTEMAEVDDGDANDHDWNGNGEEVEEDEDEYNPIPIFNRTPRWSNGSQPLDEENLPDHIRIMVDDGEKYYICEICEQAGQGRPGRSPQHTENHKTCSLISFENFGYKCKACGEISKKKCDARRHIWTSHRSMLNKNLNGQ